MIQNAIADMLEELSEEHPVLFEDIMKQCGLVVSKTKSEVKE